MKISPDEIMKICYEVGGWNKNVVVYSNHDPEGHVERIFIEMDKENFVTFDVLKRLSEKFQTRDINLKLRSGFGGSDVTPPDPTELCVEIKNIGRWLDA